MWTDDIIPFLQLLFVPGVSFYFWLAFLSEWIDRKIVAKLQNRVGPLGTGPGGILQPLADFLKLLSKEDIMPLAVNQRLFSLTPLVIFSLSMVPLFVIPIIDSVALIQFEGDLIFIIFLTTLLIINMFLSAWSSTNQFGIIGGTRIALQMFGYEIPLTIAMIGPAISAQSLSLSKIVQSQLNGKWYLFTQPLGFIAVTLSFLAELHFQPFDNPKAETEIVTGWLVEFSGKKFALLRMAKNFELVLAASLMASLYLGGSLGPWEGYQIIYFLLKFMVCLLLLSNLRALFARFRIDQVLIGAWKVLTPLALCQIILIELMAVMIP